MRLASWNIQHHARAEALRAIADVVSTFRCDVLALQEVSESSVGSLTDHLCKLGLGHVAVHEHDDGWWLLTASRSPVAILPAARTIIPVNERDHYRNPPTEDGSVARILSVRLSSPDIVLHNAHVPPGSSAGWRKVDAFRAISGCVSATAPQAQIVCGDLNEPRSEAPNGEVSSWAHHNKYAHKNPLLWDQAVLALLRGEIVADCFRAVHGDAVCSMWSHRSKSASRRYDHVLASPALQPVLAEYVGVTCSDHRPAVVEFRIVRQ
jgi:exonuclease III